MAHSTTRRTPANPSRLRAHYESAEQVLDARLAALRAAELAEQRAKAARDKARRHSAECRKALHSRGGQARQAWNAYKPAWKRAS